MSARAAVRKADLDKLAAVLTDRGQVVGRVELRPDGTISITALTAIPKETPDDASADWDRLIGGAH